MTFAAVMISCEKRVFHRNQTLLEFPGECPIFVVLDSWACEEKGLNVQTPQERQERASKLALETGLAQGTDYILFLEDDLTFNDHFWHNLQNWGPIRDGVLEFGSLYNPNVAGDISRYPNTLLAEPCKVYGSQAFVLSRKCAQYCIDHWDEVEGMQDIKISRLAGRIGLLYYHSPCLVQHVGTQSAWTEENRFHQTGDFNKEWKA